MFTASAPGLYLFAAQCPTPPILYLRFAANLTVGLAQDSRPSGSLLLSCKALSSSTFMPVYPGAQTSGLRSKSHFAPQSVKSHGFANYDFDAAFAAFRYSRTQPALRAAWRFDFSLIAKISASNCSLVTREASRP